MTETIISGVLIMIIGGVITVLSKHLINSDIHPSKKELEEELVHKDVYNARHDVLIEILKNCPVHQERIEQNARAIIIIQKDMNHLKDKLDESTEKQELMINTQQEILKIIKKEK